MDAFFFRSFTNVENRRFKFDKINKMLSFPSHKYYYNQSLRGGCCRCSTNGCVLITELLGLSIVMLQKSLGPSI